MLVGTCLWAWAFGRGRERLGVGVGVGVHNCTGQEAVGLTWACECKFMRAASQITIGSPRLPANKRGGTTEGKKGHLLLLQVGGRTAVHCRLGQYHSLKRLCVCEVKLARKVQLRRVAKVRRVTKVSRNMFRHSTSTRRTTGKRVLYWKYNWILGARLGAG